MRAFKGILLATAITLAVIVCGVALYVLFIERDTTFVRQNLAAFLGAIVGFSLSFFAIWVNKIIDRRKLNYDTLVRLRFELSINYRFLEHNRRNFDGGLVRIDQGLMYLPHVRALRADENLPSKLTNTGLLNDSNCLNLNILDFNKDIERLQEFETGFADMVVQKDLALAAVQARNKHVRPKVQGLRNFCDLLDDRIIDCRAKVKVLTRQQKPLYIARLTRRYSKKILEEATREQGIIRSQMAESKDEEAIELKKYGPRSG